MGENAKSKRYDLEDRTFAFARNVREFVKGLGSDQATKEDVKQLVRSSGSVGANYIEANESLGKKDFLMRIRISRKEAKESRYWLKLLEVGNSEKEKQREALQQEATELMNIFGAILKNSQQRLVFQKLEFYICFGFRYSNFVFSEGVFYVKSTCL